MIILKGKQDVPKVYGFSPFLRWIHPRKTENNAKNQKFPRNCILRYIELHKSQVPDESQNSYKNYPNTPFFGTKMYFLRYKIGP